MAKTLGWTYDDLKDLPEDLYRYEVLDGLLVREPPPTTRHETLVSRLVAALVRALAPGDEDGLFIATTGVVFDDQNVVQPDVAYVVPERRSRTIREDALHGAPDLVIEVLSPSTRDRDLIAKRALYARAGVPEYWVVAPEQRTVIRFTSPRDGRYREVLEVTSGEVRSSVVPGFVLRCPELFGPYS